MLLHLQSGSCKQDADTTTLKHHQADMLSISYLQVHDIGVCNPAQLKTSGCAAAHEQTGCMKTQQEGLSRCHHISSTSECCSRHALCACPFAHSVFTHHVLTGDAIDDRPQRHLWCHCPYVASELNCAKGHAAQATLAVHNIEINLNIRIKKCKYIFICKHRAANNDGHAKGTCCMHVMLSSYLIVLMLIKQR